MTKKFNNFVFWAGVALGTLMAPRAYADIITVQGTSSGEFFDSSNTNQGTSLGHIAFTGLAFGPINSDQLLTLATIDLDNGTFDYDNFTFQLLVSFTQPAGASGAAITAAVTGSVHGNDGNVTLDFPSIPTLFTYGNGGSFELTVQDLTVDLDTNGGTGALKGSLSNVVSGSLGTAPPAVPEPQSMVLLATCLAGIVLLTKRRFANSR